MRRRWEPGIVAGVDCRDEQPTAVTVAVREARLRRRPLLLLTAHPPVGCDGPHTTLTTLLRHVRAEWPEVRATARNLTGEPADELIEASRHAALVVVGRRADEQPGLSHSVSAQVAAHAFSPTVVVPPGAELVPDAPVLLGVGMSGDEDAAIEFGFGEASLRGVPLLAVHVWSGVPAAALGAVSPFAYDLRAAQASADRALAETLAGWAEKYPDVPVERMPLYDVHPAQAMLDASPLGGLVVVGARRYAHRSSHLLGLVTRTLIRQARRPIAVIRP